MNNLKILCTVFTVTYRQRTMSVRCTLLQLFILCTVFTVTYQQRTMSVRCTLLQLFILCTVFTVTYRQRTMSVRCTLLQLFCFYNLCYMYFYLARETCSVISHKHFPQYVCSAQYGCFLQFLNFVLSPLCCSGIV
jgi:hypothetical protein